MPPLTPDEMGFKGDRNSLSVQQSIDHIFSAVSGDPRQHSLEHRLFNTISLLNGVTNIGGAFAVISNHSHPFLLALHLGTGVPFVFFYYLSRFRNRYDSLYFGIFHHHGVIYKDEAGNQGCRTQGRRAFEIRVSRICQQAGCQT